MPSGYDYRAQTFTKLLIENLSEEQLLIAARESICWEWKTDEQNAFLRNKTLGCYLFKYVLCRYGQDNFEQFKFFLPLNNEKNTLQRTIDDAKNFYLKSSFNLKDQLGLNPSIDLSPKDFPVMSSYVDKDLENIIQLFYREYYPGTNPGRWQVVINGKTFNLFKNPEAEEEIVQELRNLGNIISQTNKYIWDEFGKMNQQSQRYKQDQLNEKKEILDKAVGDLYNLEELVKSKINSKEIKNNFIPECYCTYQKIILELKVNLEVLLESKTSLNNFFKIDTSKNELIELLKKFNENIISRLEEIAPANTTSSYCQ